MWLDFVSGKYCTPQDSHIFFLHYTIVESSIIYNFICDHSVTMFFSCSNPYINQILSFVLLCSVRSAGCCLVWIICSFLPQLWRFLLLTGIRKSFLPAPPIWAPAPSSMPPSFYYALSKTTWLTVQVISVFYRVGIAMMNSLIYSPRIKDMKETIRQNFPRLTNIQYIIFVTLFLKLDLL